MELAEVADAIEDEIASFDRDSRVDSDQLLSVLELRERVEVLALSATGAWDRIEQWRENGALTPVAWLRDRARMSTPDARRLVRGARLVDRHPVVAKAASVGEFSSGHVEAWARNATPPRADLFDDHVDAVVEATAPLSPDDTATAARRWAGWADDVLGRGEPADLHARRGVWVHQVGDLVDGHLLGTPEEMAAVLAALDRVCPPDPTDTPGGPRTLAQRRYDALVDLAGVGLADAHGHIDPTHRVNVIIDAATLAGEYDPLGTSRIDGFGSVLPASVQQLLCGSWISRVVMSSKGEILDLGRDARLFSPAQRRAILIRDGGCALANCDRPPQWCDVHHLDPYGPPTNGETNLDNGVGMCRPHHTLVHKGWRPWQDADGKWYLEPP